MAGRFFHTQTMSMHACVTVLNAFTHLQLECPTCLVTSPYSGIGRATFLECEKHLTYFRATITSSHSAVSKGLQNSVICRWGGGWQTRHCPKVFLHSFNSHTMHSMKSKTRTPHREHAYDKYTVMNFKPHKDLHRVATL